MKVKMIKAEISEKRAERFLRSALFPCREYLWPHTAAALAAGVSADTAGHPSDSAARGAVEIRGHRDLCDHGAARFCRVLRKAVFVGIRDHGAAVQRIGAPALDAGRRDDRRLIAFECGKGGDHGAVGIADAEALSGGLCGEAAKDSPLIFRRREALRHP